MDDRFDKLEEKIEKLDLTLQEINITLIRNTDSLEHHVERTNTLQTLVENELPPIKEHVSMIQSGIKGILWFCAAVSGVAGFVYLLFQILQ